MNVSLKSRFVDGGKSTRCDAEGEIVEVNLAAFDWKCSTNTNYCPGLGGFKVGCKDLTTTTTKTTTTTSTTTTTTTTSSSNVQKSSFGGLMLLAILAFVK